MELTNSLHEPLIAHLHMYCWVLHFEKKACAKDCVLANESKSGVCPFNIKPCEWTAKTAEKVLEQIYETPVV